MCNLQILVRIFCTSAKLRTYDLAAKVLTKKAADLQLSTSKLYFRTSATFSLSYFSKILYEENHLFRGQMLVEFIWVLIFSPLQWLKYCNTLAELMSRTNIWYLKKLRKFSHSCCELVVVDLKLRTSETIMPMCQCRAPFLYKVADYKLRTSDKDMRVRIVRSGAILFK